MPLYTVEEIIVIAKNSQWICSNEIGKGGLYGGGIDLQLPRKIKAIRQNVEWMFDLDGGVIEVNAVAYITITSIGVDGYSIEVFINDPILGAISLGTYTKVSGDTNTTILATNIASALDANNDGYDITSTGNVISIEARIGLGASVNGGSRLSVLPVGTPAVAARTTSYFDPTRTTTGTVYTTTANDPNLGVITLSTYTQQAGDTTTAIFIANLITDINTNVYGYSATPRLTDSFYLYAPAALGDTINGNAGEVAWLATSIASNFANGVNGAVIIPNTLTQFAGGITEVAQNSTLTATSNYLLALCSPYSFEAASKSGNGGSASQISSQGRYEYAELPIDVVSGYPIEGEFTYQSNDLKGAKDLSFIVVNNNVETAGVDFTFDPISGTLTRQNAWGATDKGTIPFNKKITT